MRKITKKNVFTSVVVVLFMIMAFASSEGTTGSVARTQAYYRFVNNSSYTVRLSTGGGSVTLSPGESVSKEGNVWFNYIEYSPNDKVVHEKINAYKIVFYNR